MKYFEEGIFGIDSVKELIDKFQKPDEALDWEIELMDYLKRLIHKKKLYDFNRNHLILLNDDADAEEMRNFFTELELKFLVILSDPTNPNCTQIKMSFQICRLCSGQKTNMLSIFALDEDNVSHATKISECCRVPPIETTDDLPKHICVECASLLHTCCQFVKMCADSDEQLRRRETILRGVVIEKVLEKALEPSPDTDDSFDISSIDLDRFTDSFGSASNSASDLAVPEVQLSPSSSSGRSSASPPTQELLILKEPEKAEICDIKKYKCEICGARFYDNYNYRAHYRIHQMVKKFECSDCGKKFKTKVILRIHKRWVQGQCFQTNFFNSRI